LGANPGFGEFLEEQDALYQPRRTLVLGVDGITLDDVLNPNIEVLGFNLDGTMIQEDVPLLQNQPHDPLYASAEEERYALEYSDDQEVLDLDQLPLNRFLAPTQFAAWLRQ
jgi:hypothetical protein